MMMGKPITKKDILELITSFLNEETVYLELDETAIGNIKTFNVYKVKGSKKEQDIKLDWMFLQMSLNGKLTVFIHGLDFHETRSFTLIDVDNRIGRKADFALRKHLEKVAKRNEADFQNIRNKIFDLG